MTSPPRITIGMPVYNGAATIAQSIESLLAQTCTDFEFIISDNASTDNTADLIADYARMDSRVRCIRQHCNLGSPGNYSFVALAARGKYLKWAAAGDWCAPTFLERSLEAIQRDPDAVLAAPRTRLFSGDLSNARDYERDIEILEEQPLHRFFHQISEMQLNNAMNGLIRISALRRTPLIEAYFHSDMVLMGRLALLGKFLLVNEPLLYRRMEPSTATSLQSEAEKRHHYYAGVNAHSLFQHWKLHLGWLRAVCSVPMPAGQRVKALEYVARRCYWNLPALRQDVWEACHYLTRSAQPAA
ncbi:MAG: glycosyltransferase family 2 protein [Longimicrobiales bacterium]